MLKYILDTDQFIYKLISAIQFRNTSVVFLSSRFVHRKNGIASNKGSIKKFTCWKMKSKPFYINRNKFQPNKNHENPNLTFSVNVFLRSLPISRSSASASAFSSNSKKNNLVIVFCFL